MFNWSNVHASLKALEPQEGENPMNEQSQQDIAAACDAIKELLLRKNKAYGDSALNPLRILSKASALEQLKVRFDDKLSRLLRGEELPDESFDQTIDDAIGYLMLIKVARKREKTAKQVMK